MEELKLEVLELKYSSIQKQQKDWSLLLQVEQIAQMGFKMKLGVELELVHILEEVSKDY